MTDSVKASLTALPDKPGVYIMRDDVGTVIYVGKAISLKNRIRQYFHESANHTPKVRAMVEHVDSFDYILTSGESEAFILECNLIKQHRPYYNIMLRDDKHYPYIRIDMHQEYPFIEITRKIMKKDNALYFGPYFGTRSVRQVIEVLRKTFPIRSCSKALNDETFGRERPCLNYHIGQCIAPCTGSVSSQEYKKFMEQVVAFLQGKAEFILRQLKEEMSAAAGRLDYERAAAIRDRLKAVENILSQQQRVISTTLEDWDILGLYKDARNAIIQLMVVRGGRMIGSEDFDMSNVQDDSDDSILASFLLQYYSDANYIPPTILLPTLPEDHEALAELLSEQRGSKVLLHVPIRGEKRQLLQMAQRNAKQSLEKELLKREQQYRKTGGAVAELSEALQLEHNARRIECYDISNIQGTDSVASMVVLEDGLPAKSQYRRFKIKTVEGANDFASMAEVIGRRFTRGLQERKELEAKNQGYKEGKFATFPDLVVVDGGAGQLHAARQVMRELGVDYLPTIGLAKQEEEIYREDYDKPLKLEKSSPALHLLQLIRDEAHRFAITYHRSLRGRRSITSLLDDIEGIGPSRRKALMLHFPTISAIEQADIEDLEQVKGINRKTAESIYQYFHQQS